LGAERSLNGAKKLVKAPLIDRFAKPVLERVITGFGPQLDERRQRFRPRLDNSWGEKRAPSRQRQLVREFSPSGVSLQVVEKLASAKCDYRGQIMMLILLRS
jgi:hypothetical protein